MDNNYQSQIGNGTGQVKLPPQNNMVLAVLATVFSVLCCGIQSLASLPLGIIALVKANSVSNLFFSGREMEANEAARNAKTYSIISLCITLVFFVISLIFMFVLGYSSVLEQMID